MIFRTLAMLVAASSFIATATAQSSAVQPPVNQNLKLTTPDASKLKAPTPPSTPQPQPEIKLDVYLFDSSKSGKAGVEVQKNGGLWGNCKWDGPNAKPVKIAVEGATVDAKLCKFAAPRGTKVTLSQSPGATTNLSAIICATGVGGMCCNQFNFELQRDGQAVGAFGYKP